MASSANVSPGNAGDFVAEEGTSSMRSGGRSSRNRRLRSISSGRKRTAERDDDELAPVEAALVDVAQAAADLRGIAQGIVEVLEVEDGRAGMGVDEVERGARGLRAGFGGRRRRDAGLR